jgi:cytochrome c553
MLKRLIVALSIAALAPMAATGVSNASETQSAEAKLDEAVVDLAAAERIFQRSCRACHGNRAQGASSYPSLADKEPEYLVEMLERYRAGERIGSNSVLMIQAARGLTDEDIAGLAVYITTAFD